MMVSWHISVFLGGWVEFYVILESLASVLLVDLVYIYNCNDREMYQD